MIPSWKIQLSRWIIEPETRWFYRYVLRRRDRFREEVLFSGPAPRGTKLTVRSNAPSALTFEEPVTDTLSSLSQRCVP